MWINEHNGMMLFAAEQILKLDLAVHLILHCVRVTASALVRNTIVVKYNDAWQWAWKQPMDKDAVQRARSLGRTVMSHPCSHDVLYNEIWQQTQFLQIQTQPVLWVEGQVSQFYMCTLRNWYLDPVIALIVHMHKDQVVSWSQYWYTQMLKAAHTVYRFTSFVTTWNQYYSQHANCFKQQASPSISGSERWSHSSLTSELAVLSVIQGIALAVTHTTFRHNHLSCKSS